MHNALKISRTDYRKNINIFSQCTKDAKIIFSRIQIFFIAALFSNYKWSTVDRMPFINTRCAFNNSLGLCCCLQTQSRRQNLSFSPRLHRIVFLENQVPIDRKSQHIMICLDKFVLLKGGCIWAKYSTFGSKKFIELEIVVQF